MTKCDVAVEIEVEIPFFDGDPMGVTWHGNYFRYLELQRLHGGSAEADNARECLLPFDGVP